MPKQLIVIWACLVVAGCQRVGDHMLEYPNTVFEPVAKAKSVATARQLASETAVPCATEALIPHVGPLQFVSKYKGSGRGRDKLNKAALEQFREGAERITQLEKALSKLSRSYVASRRDRRLLASCYVDILAQWAAADALLNPDANHTGASMRKWALGTISANYLVIRPAVDLADDRLPMIKDWLSKVSELVVNEWSNRPEKKVNNHDFWAAWSTIATAVVLNDRSLYEWSLYKYREGMTLIREDGTIEKEISRRTRALAYHNYALAPLLHIAHFAYANGDDFLTDQDAPIHRLAKYVIQGLNHPTSVEQTLGYEQVLDGVYTPYGLAWIPIYKLYFDDPPLGALATKTDRYSATRLGGDIRVSLQD